MKYPRFKQWNTEDLFNEALRLVKENGYYPDESDLPLESCNAYAERDQLIFSDDWEPEVSVDYGGSEGIYIDVYISGPSWYSASDNAGAECRKIEIGIAKTLNEDINSFVKMSTLAGAIKAYLTEIWNDNACHFVTPEGAKKIYEDQYFSITDRIGRAQTSDDVERCRQYIRYVKVLSDADRAELLSACDEKEKQRYDQYEYRSNT